MVPDEAKQADPFAIEDEAHLRSFFGQKHPLAVRKVQTRIDRHGRDYIARSPFLCLATTGPDGGSDVTPRGDPCGFVKVLDDKHIAIPDRPGNNRLDSLTNILANPAVGVLFLIPGFDDTYRVNGRARITHDPALLEEMAVNGRQPKVAIMVDVEEAFLHCAKAFKRSKLWDPDSIRDRKEMPSLARMILEQVNEKHKEKDLREIDQALEEEYKTQLY